MSVIQEYAMYLSIVSGLSDAIKNRIQLALSQQVCSATTACHAPQQSHATFCMSSAAETVCQLFLGV